jgi:hypothetical protein
MEEWRPVPLANFPGYAASDQSRIYSWRKRAYLTPVAHHGKSQTHLYQYVAITDTTGHRRWKMIAHLVLLAFGHHRTRDQVVHYADRDRANVRLDNISWADSPQWRKGRNQFLRSKTNRAFIEATTPDSGDNACL